MTQVVQGQPGKPPGSIPGPSVSPTHQVSLDPNLQQFSTVLAKQLADLHASVMQMHMNEMWSHQDKDSETVLSPPAWAEPSHETLPVSVIDINQPRIKWEPKVQFQPSPRQSEPTEPPERGPTRLISHDTNKASDGKTSDGEGEEELGSQIGSVPPSPTSPGAVIAKKRSLWSQEAQPCPNHPLPVKAKMPNTASRQVTRIDDFDDIVTKGYHRLRKKRRNIQDDKEHDAKSRRRRRLINSLFLEPAICAVLVINAIQIGVSMDVASDATWWAYVDLTFVTIYTLELFFKIVLLGWKEFLSCPQVWFNMFDVIVITLALVGVVLTLSYSSDSGQMSNSIVIVRLVRLARITRIIRLLRFAIFKELLTMIAGLVSGLRTLLWAFVLLFLAIYPMSLVLTQFLGQDDSTREDMQMRELFKSVPRSMLTVFRCVTGDCNYSDGTPVILELVEKYGAVWIPLYVVVMLIVTFGLFNLIMAIFVDNALADAKRQERELKLARLKDREMQKEKTAHLLEMLLDRIIEESLHHTDTGETSRELHEGLEKVTHMSVSKEVFNDFMLDPEVTDILDALDVPEEERLDLFEVLDANGNGTLQLEELINGVIKLRGDPRRSDTIHVLLVIRSLQEEMQDFKGEIFEKMESVQYNIDMLCNLKQ